MTARNKQPSGWGQFTIVVFVVLLSINAVNTGYNYDRVKQHSEIHTNEIKRLRGLFHQVVILDERKVKKLSAKVDELEKEHKEFEVWVKEELAGKTGQKAGE